MPLLETSVATVSLSGTLAEKLAAAQAAGFDGVEIFEHDLLAGPLTPEDVRRRCADLGLTITMFQPFRDVDSREPATFQANLRRLGRKMELMDRLGTELILVCSHVGEDAVSNIDQLSSQLHTVGRLAAEHGVRVAYEALAWGRHVNDYRVAAEAVALADHPAVGTCLDSFHILSRGLDPAGILELPATSLFFLQLADAPRMGMDVLPWSRHYRCFPGQGNLDVTSVTLNALLAGYTGPLSLEVFNDVFRQAPAPDTARDAYRSLMHLQDQVRQRIQHHRTDGVRAFASELDRVEGLLLPGSEPPHPRGLAFVEFEDDVGAPLADLLDKVGFARARTTPEATAWSHAGVWLATRPSRVAQQARVTGLGLRVEEPTAAARRAETLGALVLEVEALGQLLPAIVAPDSTRITFCPIEDPGPAPAGAGAGLPGLTGIDHVALTQVWHDFDGAVLFLRSVLGLTAQASHDVPDPYGLVRSTAMTTPHGEVCLALNVPPRGIRGARVETGQHVAFATSDLLATATHLQQRGVPLLEIPDNYYEDLQALYDLTDQRSEDLRARHVLLDRSPDNGEYLQLFTRTVGGVFLEFVQRSPTYTGFGARNAPFRLAAQSRV
ncbi:MAG: TIM barrel protein [Ornithinimicrobium sp.]|uniref:sugar phosphate isomerase/epimerase and 4-hydroxyphenylpyruvate domain-containing protein n=1 Tax=Ornithinimicrobium sp. TaxID=1977084 RepID=UPI0026DEFA26|nr:sugar phosphate isomerase/epimerase and 4-hydroxyphenylpyruvate domain-containing protein [Ornithinimicrobium sp.]MDO5739987.1 TIM barrel protein [Ornithinimicrobium sp.]